jgi:Protein ENHANCED DISEASE RESISTANCE 2, C-terminal
VFFASPVKVCVIDTNHSNLIHIYFIFVAWHFRLKGALGGNFRKKPSFLVSFRFPWGLLVLYFQVPDKLKPFLRMHGSNEQLDKASTNNFSIAERALSKWFAGDTEYKNERLKLIAYVPEGPWMVRNMVTGRPAIIGKKLPVSYQYVQKEGHREEFLMCDLDIGSSKPAAKRIVSVCRRYMSALSVDIGFVIEGNCEEDLPEEMFGAIRIHQADPIRSPAI